MNIQPPIQLTGDENGYWFISAKNKLWLPNGNIPSGLAKTWQLAGMIAHPIGQLDGQSAWLIIHSMKKSMSSVRCLVSDDDIELFHLAARAIQLAEFYRSHHYCGYCGHKMHISKTEWCVLCSHCPERYYPQISPSMIVAIRHKNHILLAKHVKHNQENLYTVLAGFTDIGETIETTVKREVFEETSLKIKNIRYVTSQPWPFPNSIMLAFLADYESGEIKVDKNELIEADWFHYEHLPRIPDYGTVARRLIEDTIIKCREYDEYGDE